MMGNLSNLGFNAEDVEPQTSFDPVPAGWYNVMITDSEMKPTKAGDGEYLHLVMTIIDGEFEGRKIWDRLNLDNPNQTAVEIAQRALSAICRAVGVMTPTDSAELHDIPLRVKVSVRPAKGEYEASNDVKGYAAYEGEAATPPPATTAPRTAAAKPAAGKGAPPWRQKKTA